MAVISAGVLVFRRNQRDVEVLLVHPGGPFWARKDLGAWSIPKGVTGTNEELLAAAKREFEEETGMSCPGGAAIDLGEIKLASGKRVHAWAVEGDVPVDQCRSNVFSQEWPPKSGRLKEFPEVDQWSYFCLAEARTKINSRQQAFIDRLVTALEG
ncbi:MAG TPA: NUDIX domain-containing protein [Prosthecobacter sp.]|nr:NUDIX domain-containing protein [Prosthecobacter sp.]